MLVDTDCPLSGCHSGSVWLLLGELPRLDVPSGSRQSCRENGPCILLDLTSSFLYDLLVVEHLITLMTCS